MRPKWLPRSWSSVSDPVDPLGPVFISYRASDAQSIAGKTAWLLRAFGVPVWHDETDLPPGDIDRRLDEALSSGLSGGVLVISREAAKSDAIRHLEAPRLLGLAQTGSFTFAVGSLVNKSGGSTELDLDAPDAILGLPRGTLRKFKQYPVSNTASIGELCRAMALQRMDLLRAKGCQELGIDLQTRSAPIGRPGNHPLIFRTRPPKGARRVPDPEAWEELAVGLRVLSDLVEKSGADRVVVEGGAHLAAAFALGAALPNVCRWGVSVKSQDSSLWVDLRAPTALTDTNIKCDAEDLTPGARRLAVFVDFLEAAPSVDTFAIHLQQERSRYAAAVRLSAVHRRGMRAEEGYRLAKEIAGAIRDEASRANVSRVSLFLLAPFPLALILGRMLNTLEVELYEWEDLLDPPQYIPVIVVRYGCSDSPIVHILDRQKEATG